MITLHINQTKKKLKKHAYILANLKVLEKVEKLKKIENKKKLNIC